MNIMERHIAWQILYYICIVAVGFGFLIILIQSLQLLSLVINNGVDILTFGFLLILALPRLLSYALPVATFIAIIWVFWRLQDDNELAVLRGAGLSDWRLLRAPMVVSFLVALLLYVFLLYINPLAREHSARLQLAIKSEFVLSLIQPGRFNVVNDSVTLYVGDMDDNFHMREIFFYDKSYNSDLDSSEQTIIAEEGQIFRNEGAIRLVVKNGSQQVMRDGSLHNLDFEEYVISLEGGDNRLFNRWQKASERSSSDLFRSLFLSSGEGGEGGEGDGDNRVRLWVEFHERMTYPLLAPLLGLWACFVMLGGVSGRRSWLFGPFTIGFVGVLGIFFTNEFLVNSMKSNIGLWFLLYVFFWGGFVSLLPWRRG